ncbi:MAG: hypothetical protein RLZZ432_849 [Chloroflexota bacterium]
MIGWTHLAERIEGATRTSEKSRLLAEALRGADDADLEIACRLLARRGGLGRDTSLSWATIAAAAEEACGAPAGSFATLMESTGDLGATVEELFEAERPLAGAALVAAEEAEQVRSAALAAATGVAPSRDAAPTLRELPALFAAIDAAAGRQRHDLIVQALYGCSPRAAKYVVRLLAGDLRVGLRDDLLTGAIASAFGADLEAVRWALTLEGDAGSVALLARRGALGEARMRLFHPIPAMLASPVTGPREIVERIEELAVRTSSPSISVEDKYDGVRAQLHASGGRVEIYGRNLVEVSASFPEIVAAALAADLDAAIDGEIIALDDGRPLPLAALQPRLAGTAQTASERERTPIAFVAFDLLALDGAPLMRAPWAERRAALESLDLPSRGDGLLRIATLQEAHGAEGIEEAFIAARMRGAEGLVAKAKGAPYAPGRRGSAWLKLKRSLDTLDCIVIGVEPGIGRHRDQHVECIVAVRDDLSGRLTPLGRAPASLGEGELAAASAWFAAHTVAQLGAYRSVEPQMVVEVAFDGIRRAERSVSGFSLRSPRIVRVRTDLGPDQAATLSAVEQRCRLHQGTLDEHGA